MLKVFKTLIFVLILLNSFELFALTLSDAISQTLQSNQNIKIKQENLNYLKGKRQSAQGLFDTGITTALLNKYTKDDYGMNNEISSDYKKLNISLNKYLRDGLHLSGGFAYKYNDIENTQKYEDKTIYLNILYPLLKNNSKDIVEGKKNISDIALEIGELNYQDEIVITVFGTIKAYLNYIKLYKIYQLNLQSKKRVKQLYEEVKMLTKADQKPRSDLKRPLVNVINENLSHINSKQALQNARHSLCLSMDISLYRCEHLPMPSDDFFPIDAAASKILSQKSIYHQFLDENRIDLKILKLKLEKLRISLNIAKDDLKDDLDLNLNLSHNNGDIINNSINFSLSYTFDVNNNSIDGKHISALSTYKQNKISLKKANKDAHFILEQHIQEIQTTISQYEEIKKSVNIYKDILEDEKYKYALGISTTFDIGQSQKSLTYAQLSMINLLYKFSLEMVQLKYYTQTLLLKYDDTFILNYKEI